MTGSIHIVTGQTQSVKMSRQELRDLAAFREMAEAHIERLGRAIQARRKELGWSRARLGREANAVEKTVERWEKAQTAGALDNVETIARALDMDPDDLLTQAVVPDRPPRPPADEISDRLSRLEDDARETRRLLERMVRELLEADEEAALLQEESTEPQSEAPGNGSTIP